MLNKSMWNVNNSYVNSNVDVQDIMLVTNLFHWPDASKLIPNFDTSPSQLDFSLIIVNLIPIILYV